MGNTQEIPEGEDVVLALEAIQRRLQDNEKLFACLDDVTVVCQFCRVCLVLAIFLEEFARHAHSSIHHGKTKCGTVVESHPGLVKPEPVMRHSTLSDDQPGVPILGVPIGSV